MIGGAACMSVPIAAVARQFRQSCCRADAPAWMSGREELWNVVEAAEKRLDAQLAREVELALPIELEDEQAIELAREFVQQEFVQHGMIADLTIRLGGSNPCANAMLTLREVTAEGFGRKVRQWNQAGLLREWREHWATSAMQRRGLAHERLQRLEEMQSGQQAKGRA